MRECITLRDLFVLGQELLSGSGPDAAWIGRPHHSYAGMGRGMPVGQPAGRRIPTGRDPTGGDVRRLNPLAHVEDRPTAMGRGPLRGPGAGRIERPEPDRRLGSHRVLPGPGRVVVCRYHVRPVHLGELGAGTPPSGRDSSPSRPRAIPSSSAGWRSYPWSRDGSTSGRAVFHQDPGGLFAALLRRGAWAFATRADEDRAARKLKGHLRGHEGACRPPRRSEGRGAGPDADPRGPGPASIGSILARLALPSSRSYLVTVTCPLQRPYSVFSFSLIFFIYCNRDVTVTRYDRTGFRPHQNHHR